MNWTRLGRAVWLAVMASLAACDAETRNEASVCAGLDCGEHGQCAEGEHGPVCVCEAGYVEDGTGCLAPSAPASPCVDVTCGGHGVCLVTGGGAPICLCDPGYDSTGAGCAPSPAPKDPCGAVTCDGHGVCLVAASGAPVCLCDAGYVSTGAACEPATVAGSPCKGIDCGGQGVCIASRAGAAVCVCKSGFESTGLGCAPLVDPCSGIDCAGLGICVVGSGGKPVCVCDAGAHAKGLDCLPNVDPCAVDPCGGHGACVVTTQGPTCLCEPGFVADGASCVPGLGDPCAGVGCGGEGTCMVASGAPVCACNPGWTAVGTTCVPTEMPCEGVTCGGLGTCLVAASGQPVCLCDVGSYAVGLTCIPAPEGAIPETAASDVALAVTHPEAGTEYVPNDLLVYAKEGHDAETLLTAVVAEGATVVAYQPQARRYIVRVPGVPTAQEFDDLTSALSMTGHVAATSPVWVTSPTADSLYPTSDSGWGLVSWDPGDVAGNNWYLTQVRAPSAWGYTTGSTTIPVGVIDRGKITNPDLVVSWVSSKDVPDKGHANKVAGVVAALGDNGKGLTGVLWSAGLYYCETDGTYTRDADCMRQLIKAGVKVINYSASLGYREKPGLSSCWGDAWTCGFKQPFPPAWSVEKSKSAWTTEIDAMPHSDWVLIQSAGNDAIEARYAAWPAMAMVDPEGEGRALIVGAVTSTGALSPFSNWGDLHLVAPGGTGGSSGNMLLLDGSATTAGWGTSFAAPLVSGAVALAWSVDPTLKASKVVSAVVEGSTKWGKSASAGGKSWPLLDIAGAVEAAIDGCGASGKTFNPATGECGAAGCVPSCGSKKCGDDGCGGTCGALYATSCAGNILQACIDGAIATKDCAASGGTCSVSGFTHACKPPADLPPTGAITAPVAWAVIDGPFKIAVQAWDDKGLVETTVKVGNVGGEVLSDSVEHPGQMYVERVVVVDTGGWQPGNYTIALWASDGVHAVVTSLIGIVYAPGCVPQCAGKECGPDGCGGTCAVGCAPGQECGSNGLCKTSGAPTALSVPAGPFWMGCNEAVEVGCYEDNKPYHQVTLSAYEIDDIEVTVSSYLDCAQKGPCAQPGTGLGCNAGVSGRDLHPINCVTWEDALTYCDWVGSRLCTEAEWEKAARGTDGQIYPWGYQPATCQLAVYDDGVAGCGTGATWPVGSKPDGASPYGALDMAGNVWEWTADWYGFGYYATSPSSNPQGPPSGNTRVARGGSFLSGTKFTRATIRNGFIPSTAHEDVGFRCCRSVP